MNEQLVQEILKRIDMAVGAAAGGGKWAFEQLVKREIAEAWTFLLVSGVLPLAIILFTVIAAIRLHKNDVLDEDMACFGAILCVACLVSITFALACNIPVLVAPEAAVIKQLLGK